MTANIKVSVIVPIYKVPYEYLNKCIISLKNQTLKEIEIILVDDGSPDECGKICDNYAKKDNRIVVVHKQNNGLAAARNTGNKIAKGQYITFVDGDDWLEDDALEYAYDVAIKEDVDILIWATRKDYNHKTIFYDYDKYLVNDKLYVEDECKLLQSYLLSYNVQIATAYSKLIKKKYVDTFNIYHNDTLRQGAEGLEYCIRLFDNAKRIKFIKKYFYHYIYNSNSISSFSSYENNNYIIKCFEEIHKFILYSKNNERLEPLFYNRLKYVILTTAISSYFSPKNKDNYHEKVKKFKEYLKLPIIEASLKSKNNFDLSITRRITLKLIKMHLFFLVNIIAKIRLKQKLN